MKDLVAKLWKKEPEPSLHYIDNKGLDKKLKKFGCNSKTGHINIKTKSLREELSLGKLIVKLISSHIMKADGLMKALPYLTLFNLLNLIDPSLSITSSVIPATGSVETSENPHSLP